MKFIKVFQEMKMVSSVVFIFTISASYLNVLANLNEVPERILPLEGHNYPTSYPVRGNDGSQNVRSVSEEVAGSKGKNNYSNL